MHFHLYQHCFIVFIYIIPVIISLIQKEAAISWEDIKILAKLINKEPLDPNIYKKFVKVDMYNKLYIEIMMVI